MVGELETIEPTVRLRSAPCLEDDKWEVIVESSGADLVGSLHDGSRYCFI